MQSRSVVLFMDNATVHPECLIGKCIYIKIGCWYNKELQNQVQKEAYLHSVNLIC